MDENKLANNISDLAGKVEKSNSYGRSFLRGLLFGLGSAIGASIVAAILIGTLNYFIQSVGDVPILKNFNQLR